MSHYHPPLFKASSVLVFSWPFSSFLCSCCSTALTQQFPSPFVSVSTSSGSPHLSIVSWTCCISVGAAAAGVWTKNINIVFRWQHGIFFLNSWSLFIFYGNLEWGLQTASSDVRLTQTSLCLLTTTAGAMGYSQYITLPKDNINKNHPQVGWC